MADADVFVQGLFPLLQSKLLGQSPKDIAEFLFLSEYFDPAQVGMLFGDRYSVRVYVYALCMCTIGVWPLVCHARARVRVSVLVQVLVRVLVRALVRIFTMFVLHERPMLV